MTEHAKAIEAAANERERLAVEVERLVVATFTQVIKLLDELLGDYALVLMTPEMRITSQVYRHLFEVNNHTVRERLQLIDDGIRKSLVMSVRPRRTGRQWFTLHISTQITEPDALTLMIGISDRAHRIDLKSWNDDQAAKTMDALRITVSEQLVTLANDITSAEVVRDLVYREYPRLEIASSVQVVVSKPKDRPIGFSVEAKPKEQQK